MGSTIRNTRLHIPIGIYESIRNLVNDKKKEFAVFANKNGLDTPKKKDLYNYAILHFTEVDHVAFFAFRDRMKENDEVFFYTTAKIVSNNRRILEDHMARLLAYAEQQGIPKPAFRDLFNFIFNQISQINCEQYFQQ